MRRRFLMGVAAGALCCVGGSAWAQARAKVTFVGFQQLESKRARLFVHMTGEPEAVVRQSEELSVVFVLSQMDVGVRNNRNPLVFDHFDTALLRAQLKPAEDNVELHLALRRKVELIHQVERRGDGEVVLNIDIPAN